MKKFLSTLLIIGIQTITFPVFANTIFQCPSMTENLVTIGNDDNGWKMQIAYMERHIESRDRRIVLDYFPPLDIKDYQNTIKSMSYSTQTTDKVVAAFSADP